MTKQDLIAAQVRLGYTNKQMAELLHVSETWVETLRRGYKWDKGARKTVVPTEKIATIINQKLELEGKR